MATAVRAFGSILAWARTSIGPGYLLSLIVVGLTAGYVAFEADPYVILGITPFLLLGSARGKHPLVLMALAVIPVLFLVLISIAKTYAVGFPLTVLDRYLIQENLLVLAYNDYRVAGLIAVLALLVTVYVVVLYSGRGRFSRFERAAAGVSMLASLVCVVVLMSSSLDFLMEEDNNHPSFKTFVRSFMVPPSNLKLAEAGPADPTGLSFVLGAPSGPKPDMVFILQESTFDPQMVDPSHRPRSLFAKKEPLSGPLHVHTVDGGTWIAEFALVTQMRAQEFGDGGWYVFHQLAGRIATSLFTKLNEQGYRTVVIYPVPGFFINGRSFYESIGVGEFHDAMSLGVSSGWDWKIPDSRLYREVLRKLDDGDSRPLAIFVSTIRQHGPHDLTAPIADYLARFAESDAAYGDLLDALKKRGRPAGVVAFGDHQPMFTGEIAKNDKAREITQYEIRCVNFKCAKSDMKRGRQLDITLLAPAALEAFGFQLDEVSRYQKSLFADCADNVAACPEPTRLKFNRVFAAAFR